MKNFSNTEAELKKALLKKSVYSWYRESKVEKDLINAGTFREIRLENFIENQFESNNFSFYEPIKKDKLRIFDIAIITKIIEVNGKDVSKKKRWRNVR